MGFLLLHPTDTCLAAEDSASITAWLKVILNKLGIDYITAPFNAHAQVSSPFLDLNDLLLTCAR